MERYRWARCKNLLPVSRMWQLGTPLPEDLLQVLHAGLTWEQFQVPDCSNPGTLRFHRLPCCGTCTKRLITYSECEALGAAERHPVPSAVEPGWSGSQWQALPHNTAPLHRHPCEARAGRAGHSHGHHRMMLGYTLQRRLFYCCGGATQAPAGVHVCLWASCAQHVTFVVVWRRAEPAVSSRQAQRMWQRAAVCVSERGLPEQRKRGHICWQVALVSNRHRQE